MAMVGGVTKLIADDVGYKRETVYGVCSGRRVVDGVNSEWTVLWSIFQVPAASQKFGEQFILFQCEHFL